MAKPLKDWQETLEKLLLLGLILALGFSVRAFNLNWDAGTHLHPDERYLTMVAAALEFPESSGDYWDTANSPLNPANRGQSDYVYGTLPLFLARGVGEAVNRACLDPRFSLADLFLQVFLGSQPPCWEGLYSGYGGVHLIGRALSVLADLGTLVALILLGRQLYNTWVGLLAGMLYAGAVLPIQHAHFFVVDSFAAVFVIWTLFFAARAMLTGRSGWLLLSGVTTGLALASKVSVWPLAAMVTLAAVVQVRQHEDHYRYRFTLAPKYLPVLFLAGMLAFVAFRVAQPYAFTGPGFFDIRLNEQWVAKMRFIRELVSGAIDTPPGHQWTRRAPILFPWRNIVVWGLGLPLGLAAWGGWAALSWRLWRRREWLHLLPWLWGTGYFLYQSTQWVKSMRYLLPIYPIFVLFAAWGLYELWRWSRQRRSDWRGWRRALSYAPLALLLVVVAGTALWAYAFLQIYVRPVTRIAASEWMYHHIPVAATLNTEEGVRVQVPLQPGSVADVNAPPLVAAFSADVTVHYTGGTLNKVSGMGMPGARTLHLSLTRDPLGAEVLSETTLTVEPAPTGPERVAFALPPVALNAGETAYLRVSVLEGPPLTLDTSVIANEHWDDGLPLRLGGRDPFWNWYRGLSSSPDGQLGLYNEDTPEKRMQLLNWLDEADYIVLSSNRLYASISRLDMRFPLTVAYYTALFDGSLGFDLLAEFVSFPSLGSYQFPDQEAPFPIPAAQYTNALPYSLHLPPAEEAFSVYDHPRVLIFAKSAAYSRANAAALLPETLLDNVIYRTPLQATRNDPTLLMDEELQAVQTAGGTWSALFNTQALQNRSQPVAVFLWWLLLTVLGWLAVPWLALAFPALRHRGYGLARIAGLLIWGYLTWLPAALRILPHTRATLWGGLALLALGSGWLVYRRWDDFRTYWRNHKSHILRIELLFAALYLTWVFIRYLNPDLRHPYTGGEKPMDFAYLNAVIKSTWFPPYDPWFANGVMNYYYFGFVLVAGLVKVTGIVPSVAYNLAVPAFFAMTGVGAYTLADNLAGGDARRGRRAGWFGVAIFLLLGNLGQLQLLFEGFKTMGNITFESLIPGYPEVVSALRGFWLVLFEGEKLSFRPEWWYWNATRIIPAEPDGVGAINEFPLFTFLYADLHAHLMALPLTQLALGVVLQWATGPLQREIATGRWAKVKTWLPHPLPTFLLAALVGGALRATNTWDYPTFLGLMGMAYLLCFLGMADPRPDLRRLLTPVLLLLTAELLFRPFTANYAIVYSSFGPWTGEKTTLVDFLLMQGHLLFPLLLLGVAQLWLLGGRLYRLADPTAMMTLGIIAIITGLLTLLLVRLGVTIAWIVLPLAMTAAFLVLDPESTPRTRVLWLLAGTALVLCLAVELIVLEGDIGRMNTVFKFYCQVWTFLALGAAVAVERILSTGLLTTAGDERPADDAEHSVWPIMHKAPTWVGDWALGLVILSLFATLLYPLLAIPWRIRDRWVEDAPRTLDGMAYMPHAVVYERGSQINLAADYQVIRWLQEHVEGSPVIMEMNAHVEYVMWGNRVSIYTGLPSVIGWRWHQVQQRGVMPPGTVEARQMAVIEFYETPDPDRALEILRRYDVTYVILTPYERAYMSQPPLEGGGEGSAPTAHSAMDKFRILVERGELDIVYLDGQSLIYQVRR